MSLAGEMISKWFGKTVILSDARFAYEEAQHIITSQTKTIPKETSLSNDEYTVSDGIYEAIQVLQNIASIRRKALDQWRY